MAETMLVIPYDLFVTCAGNAETTLPCVQHSHTIVTGYFPDWCPTTRLTTFLQDVARIDPAQAVEIILVQHIPKERLSKTGGWRDAAPAEEDHDG